MENSQFILARMVVLLLPNFVVSFSMKSTTSTNISRDQQALLALKAHLSSDLLTTNWSTATSICNWIGVTCGSRHLRVTGLDLFGMNLSGTIPPHLGNLSFLTRLNLESNFFHGSLPVELANLRRLKSIKLSDNNFNGEIPPWFSSFTQLRNFSLSSNNLTGVIPSSLWSLSKLENLLLSENNLEGPIPEAIGNLSSLRNLYLSYNQLSSSIPSSIFNISSLENISLRSNWIFGSIPSIPINMSSLQTFDFSFNNLTGQFPSDMFDRLPKLKRLYLSYNQLSGKIPMSLFKCKELEHLFLAVNHFEGTVLKEIGNLTMLKLVDLGDNHLKGDQIPQQIGNLKSLEELKLQNCGLIGSIPSVVGNLTVLKTIDFTDNRLKGEIPVQLGNLPTLEGLYLGKNSISGLVPPRIFNSSTLKIIVLTLNRFSGFLPSTTGLRLPKLEILEIGGNKFSGPIPTYISNASQLTVFDIENNSFSGYVPIDLGNLRHLQILTLEDNNLASTPSSSELRFLSSLENCKDLGFLAFDTNPLISGELPRSIGNLSVEEFVAHGCNIKGSIPREIGNLSNLIYLDIANNALTGSIPTTIGRLRNLQSLSLDNNKLEGSLPIELCQLKSLGFMYFSRNKLTGQIPGCLGDLLSLRHLFLDSNKFASSIPSTLTRLIDILQLNLSSNSLSRTLPIDIGKWRVVTIIDFSQNQLSGEILRSIGDLTDLTYLSLSGNRLQGSVQETFGSLIGLEVLDLSRNNLSGIIPKSLEKLLYLEYFNVSFNRLVGEIPKEGPFPNFSIGSFMGNEALCAAAQLQLPLPPCKANSFEQHSKKAIKLVKYILLPTGSIIFVFGLILIFLGRRKRKELPTTDQENSQALTEWRRVSYHELHQATNGFSESKLLGVGSFGSVYQGTLSDGLSVAVKVFNLELEGAFKSFDIECEVLRNIRHRNLVQIISSCSNIDFKALILQFMPNGSLEKWLYSHNQHFPGILDRLNIMIDVACALEYLHHCYTTPVIHCDLKPSNVLLDQDMVAHLGDFGIAKLVGEEHSTIHTMTLATIGYMAPEYGADGIVSIKGDVYTFGILMIETFTRKKPTDNMFVGEMSLKHWVNESLPSKISEIADANLLIGKGERELLATKECALSVLQLALECSKELTEERTDMKEVVAKLKKIKIKFLKDLNGQA